MSQGQLFERMSAIARGPEPGAFAMERGAELAGPCRYSLSRRWDASKPWAAWLMCNPSTADASIDDPTVRRVIHFSRHLGAGGALVVNVWPLRTPYPAALWQMLRAGELSAEQRARNSGRIQDAAMGSKWLIAAFGAEPGRRYPADLREALFRVSAGAGPDGIPRLCLGTTADGWPLHPLAHGKFAIPNSREPMPCPKFQ